MTSVILELPQKKYLSDLYFWRFEDEVQESFKWNGSYFPKPTTKLSKQEFIEQEFKNKYLLETIPSTMFIIKDEEFIGTVHACWESEVTSWMEIGIVIYNPDYWSGGYGTSALKQWIDYIFTNSDIHRIGFSTWSGNIRMIKLAEKLGMQQEACIRKARIVEGEYYDAIKMGMLREEWKCHTL